MLARSLGTSVSAIPRRNLDPLLGEHALAGKHLWSGCFFLVCEGASHWGASDSWAAGGVEQAAALDLINRVWLSAFVRFRQLNLRSGLLGRGLLLIDLRFVAASRVIALRVATSGIAATMVGALALYAIQGASVIVLIGSAVSVRSLVKGGDAALRMAPVVVWEELAMALVAVVDHEVRCAIERGSTNHSVSVVNWAVRLQVLNLLLLAAGGRHRQRHGAAPTQHIPQFRLVLAGWQVCFCCQSRAYTLTHGWMDLALDEEGRRGHLRGRNVIWRGHQWFAPRDDHIAVIFFLAASAGQGVGLMRPFLLAT